MPELMLFSCFEIYLGANLTKSQKVKYLERFLDSNMIRENTLNIYTDGSSFSSPRRAYKQDGKRLLTFEIPSAELLWLLVISK